MALYASLLTLAMLCAALAVFVHSRMATHASPHAPGKQAEDLYLQGRYFWSLRSEADLTRSVDLFTQAIVLDPNFAAAYAGLADSYILLRQYGKMRDADAFPRAYAAAERATALDPDSPDGHRSLAFILNYWKWDFPAAEREFRRALELAPKDAQTHHWYASALWSQGHFEAAREQIDIARILDPESVSTLSDRALFYQSIDKEASLATWRQLVKIHPSLPSAHDYLGFEELLQHDYAGFLTEQRALAQLHNDPEQAEVTESCQKALDKDGSAAMLRLLATRVSRRADAGRDTGFSAAHFLLVAGDKDHAIQYLQLSYARHEPAFLSIRHDAIFDPLRNDPRFIALIAHLDEPAR